MQSLAEIEKKKVAIQKAYLVSCVNSRVEDLEAAAAVLRGKKVAPGVKFYVGAASAWVQQEAEQAGVWQTLLDAGAIPLPPSCGPCIGLGTGTAGKRRGRHLGHQPKFQRPHGIARCAMLSGESGSRGGIGRRRIHHRPASVRGSRTWSAISGVPTDAQLPAERVEILPGFPERVRGRLVFMPQDNVNTDAIYGKDYTYRDDMTPEMMARVVMENYDPQFAARTRAGDVIVGGFNFGTGSSREQAVTCLKAKGIPLVIAASFSQTYLRNAYNNGFLCIEVPGAGEAAARAVCEARSQAKEKTIIPGETSRLTSPPSTLHWRGASFAFPPLGRVPQSLVIAGGAENVVAQKLGLHQTSASIQSLVGFRILSNHSGD